MLTPTEATSGRAPATSQQPVPAPCRTSHRQGSHNEALRGFTQFARPVFPSPVAARMERAALGLEPRASHPADQEPHDARQGGDRPSSTDLELHAQLTSVDLQSGSPLVVCDLGSHVAKAVTRRRAGRKTKAIVPADYPAAETGRLERRIARRAPRFSWVAQSTMGDVRLRRVIVALIGPMPIIRM